MMAPRMTTAIINNTTTRTTTRMSTTTATMAVRNYWTRWHYHQLPRSWPWLPSTTSTPTPTSPPGIQLIVPSLRSIHCARPASTSTTPAASNATNTTTSTTGRGNGRGNGPASSRAATGSGEVIPGRQRRLPQQPLNTTKSHPVQCIQRPPPPPQEPRPFTPPQAPWNPAKKLSYTALEEIRRRYHDGMAAVVATGSTASSVASTVSTAASSASLPSSDRTSTTTPTPTPTPAHTMVMKTLAKAYGIRVESVRRIVRSKFQPDEVTRLRHELRRLGGGGGGGGGGGDDDDHCVHRGHRDHRDNHPRHPAHQEVPPAIRKLALRIRDSLREERRHDKNRDRGHSFMSADDQGQGQSQERAVAQLVLGQELELEREVPQVDKRKHKSTMNNNNNNPRHHHDDKRKKREYRK